MELTKTIKERCCLRNFNNKKPSKEQLTSILEAGRLAPSWVNVQPWHFIVVQDKETIDLLAELSFDQGHVKGANTLIVCCGLLDTWNEDQYKATILTRPNLPEEKVNFLMTTPAFNPKLLGQEAVLLRTVEEITYAIAYMTLEIENQGLSGCIIGGIGNPLTKSKEDIHEKACKKLNMPKNSLIVAILVVGYSDEEKPEKVRKDFNQVISFNTFGNKF